MMLYFKNKISLKKNSFKDNSNDNAWTCLLSFKILANEILTIHHFIL